ncbi:MAG: FHA domain-containing protein [Lachnospiraceae bacterium]|nr:FHA domain-containing protein [Lachnospiraceae bacterium]
MGNFFNALSFIFICLEIVVVFITYYKLLKQYRYAIYCYKKSQNRNRALLVEKKEEDTDHIVISDMTQKIEEDELLEMINSPILNFSLDGKNIKEIIFRNEKIFIGRGKSDDIVIDEPTISRSNCVITKENDKYFINIDKNKNPIQINKRQIGTEGPLRKEISNGDVVSMGNGRISFEFKSAY